uniref:Cytochrome c oxidase subunit 2 n=1 Tax=Polyascus gregaria TaxID=238043 RepID=H8ZWN2_9CRUS|nr:cytochrome oxidase subunit II [Polyascus gregaria]
MNNFFSLGFQDCSSYIMYEFMKFFDFVNFLSFFVSFLVIFLIMFLYMNNYYYLVFSENNFLEIMWTLIPIIIMFAISLPSLFILYSIDFDNNYVFSVKIEGNQWYWSYDYSSFSLSINFDSYMVHNSDSFRLLEVDNRMVMPMNILSCLLVTSSDVIHSFSVPSLGFKVDAIPGRILMFSLMILKSGVFYGQCSEICGLNHSYMPIVIESVNLNCFLQWVSDKINNN